MSVVNITNINVLQTCAQFQEPYKFEITFECLSELDDDLEFKLIYVGSADDEKLDQELDSILVGPVPVGVNRFVFETDPPDVSKIPEEELLGITVVLLTCSYKNKEFVRVGYYVNNEYNTEELRETPPERPVLEKIYREILANKPRVTRFPINWDNPEVGIEPQPQIQPPEPDPETSEASSTLEKRFSSEIKLKSEGTDNSQKTEAEILNSGNLLGTAEQVFNKNSQSDEIKDENSPANESENIETNATGPDGFIDIADSSIAGENEQASLKTNKDHYDQKNIEPKNDLKNFNFENGSKQDQSKNNEDTNSTKILKHGIEDNVEYESAKKIRSEKTDTQNNIETGTSKKLAA
ncbi:hypothetical protein BB560_000894 [Smittium megazygosporum]|uniref:Anti-silencing function protein 1 n=1 Tax=Smittium megazygosporum TaxID=133381 RepID=A0A2T9ZJB3_9FUNG|nr:hypothetical protein BB560_000894 [Smittium megazygosporum]